MNESLTNFLRGVDALAAFADTDVEALAKAAEIRQYELDQVVLEAGTSGEGLYVVFSGKFHLFAMVDGVEESVALREPGDLVGELSALREVPVEQTIRAASKSELLFIPRDKLHAVAKNCMMGERLLTQYIVISSAGNVLNRILNLPKDVSRDDIARIINSIGVKKIDAGETVFAQGSTEDRRLYIVRSGQMRLERTYKDNTYAVALLDAEDICGEKACLDNAPHPETATATCDTVVFVLPQDITGFVVERNPSLRHLLRDHIEQRDREFKRQQKLTSRRQRRILLDVFSSRGWGRNVLKHFPLVEQEGDNDAGAACIDMVCSYYGLEIPHNKLREMASKGEADLLSLAKVGERLGFTCKEMTATTEMLQTFDLPFVIQWRGYHSMVVYGITRKRVWLADPANGFTQMSIKEFEEGWNGQVLTFTPSEEIRDPNAYSGNPWIRFLRYLVPHRKIVRDIFIATLITEVLGLISPLLTQAIVDKVLVHSNLHLLNVLVIGAGMALLFMNLVRVLRSYLINFLIRKMDFEMMAQFYKHVLALPVSFFIKRKVGDIMACFNENQKIRQFLTYTSILAVLNILMLVIYTCVMLTFNVSLSLVFVAFMPVFALITVYASPRYAENARRKFFADAAARAVLTESLNAAETIKGMGLELPMRLEWERKYVDAVNQRYESEFFASKIRTLTAIADKGLILCLMWYGARLVIEQELTVGQLMAFIQLAGTVLIPLGALLATWNQLHEVGVSIERLGEVLDLPPEQDPADAPCRVVIPNIKGEIQLDNVSFGYGGLDSPYVLKNVDARFRPGKLYAVVGASGVGKTSLVKMLIGVIAPTEGTIFVDGYDLSNIDLTAYRSQIGFALQVNTLFAGTLNSNIAIGDSNPDFARVIEVGHWALLDDLVKQNPLGYEMKIGERGSGLSSEQSQRVALARALYNDPRILVLDEATSTLDENAEEQFFQNIVPIIQERVTVIVSNRLATVRRADHIFALDEGVIAEEGSHDELVARKGVYHELFEKQIRIAALLGAD